MADWLTDWLAGWLTDRLTDWLIDWLTGWLADLLVGTTIFKPNIAHVTLNNYLLFCDAPPTGRPKHVAESSQYNKYLYIHLAALHRVECDCHLVVYKWQRTKYDSIGTELFGCHTLYCSLPPLRAGVYLVHTVMTPFRLEHADNYSTDREPAHSSA